MALFHAEYFLCDSVVGNRIHVIRFLQPYHTIQMDRLHARANYPPSQVPANHVDEIAIATLYLLVMLLMAVLIRLVFRLYILSSLYWDDWIVVLSSVCSFVDIRVLLLLLSNKHLLIKQGAIRPLALHSLALSLGQQRVAWENDRQISLQMK